MVMTWVVPTTVAVVPRTTVAVVVDVTTERVDVAM
jgi:hypothetical protein